MMHDFVKVLWTGALLDPDAQQTKKRLGLADGGRCCLGTLCDIAVAHGIIPPPTELVCRDWSGRPTEVELIYAGSWSTLPPVVMEWAGLTDEDPIVEDDERVVRPLSAWNDDGYTFPQIAAMIERSL
jgi:hypothetical protein